MHAIREALAGLELGAAKTYRQLTVVPLLAERDSTPDYRLLDEALRDRHATVTETSDFGAVPELRFRNHGDRPVLLVDGEELVGAKQNRVLNITLLVGAGQEVLIPVSCVEQGRWAWRTPQFASGGRTLFAAARARKMTRVSQSLRAKGRPEGDQREVWQDIGVKLSAMQARSPSMAMSDAYAAREHTLDEYRNAFQACSQQVGAAFAIAGRLVGAELFDAEVTFARFLPKLVASYALDALEPGATNGKSPLPLEAQVGHLLGRLRSATFSEYRGIGEGAHLRLEDADLAAGGLVARGRLVHLAAFTHAGRRGTPRAEGTLH